MIKTNYILLITLAVLLIICLFKLPYEYYEIIRFIVTAEFVWLAISIKGSEKYGWRFFWGTLAILFNPFYKLKIGADIFKVIDIAVSSLIFVLLIKEFINFKTIGNKLISFYRFLNKRKKILFYSFTFLAFAFIITYAIIITKQQAAKREMARIEKIKRDSLSQVQHRQDSIQLQQDSINNENRKIEEQKNQLLEAKICTEDNALKNFKKWLAFYHPEWRIRGKINIKTDRSWLGDNCTYKISALVYNVNYSLLDETLIVEIDLNSDGNYAHYRVTAIESPW